MAIDAGKTAVTYCYNAAPAIKCVHTRCAVIKYRLIDGDEGEQRRMLRMGRVADKRKTGKKGGRESMAPAGVQSARRETYAEEGRKIRREDITREGKSIVISLESIDRVWHTEGPPPSDDYRRGTYDRDKYSPGRGSGAAIYHRQIV